MGERENKYVSECERVKKKKFFVFTFIFFNQSVSHTRTQKIVFYYYTKFPLYTKTQKNVKIHS